MVSKYDQQQKRTTSGNLNFNHSYRHYAINACLAPLYSVEGMHVITVEGVGSCRNGLHPIQESLAKAHGTQCGFCTPGFIMSMYSLLRSSKTPPTEDQIEESLAGNLCRCTGYRPIVDAFRVFAKSNDSSYTNSFQESETISNGTFICPSSGKPCSCGGETINNIRVKYNETDGSLYSEKELIFPPELILRDDISLNLQGFSGIRWYRPLSLQEVLNLKSQYPDAKLVVGNTEVGIEMRFKHAQYQVLISVTHVPELNKLCIKEDGLDIGASIRLTELANFVRKIILERKTHEISSCKAILEQLRWFAGNQIKNVASVGGNICTASPISDLNPLWMASRANFNVIDCNGNIRTVRAKDFFLGYRKINLAENEILLSVFLPWTREYEFVKEFKQAHRREDDIAIVNAGMRVFLEIDGSNWKIGEVCIVYGGVAPVSFAMLKTEKFVTGMSWEKSMIPDVLKMLREEIPVSENAPGGMVEFRKSLVLSFFFKFFLWVTQQMNERGFLMEGVDVSYQSAIQPYSRPLSRGTQSYESVRVGTAVGQPMIHLSSKLQVTGEAEYIDDMPIPQYTLHAALLLSEKPHARILSIEDSLAKLSPGFVGLFLSKDIPGSNKIGVIVQDEQVFATDIVTCVGQVIGIVVADTHENAMLASSKVQIKYEELPAVLSLKDAINSGSFFPNARRCLLKGDVDQCFESGICNKIIEGEIPVAGQEHFYFEPHSTLVWTLDGGNEVHMFSSTQAPSMHQNYIARVLGLPLSKVVCKTKRIGGGFGGKETRSGFVAAAACVPAYLLKRPVKITLDRNIDMMISGQRHSFIGKYKVGFTNEGKIMALDLEIYNNGGNTLDLSLEILDRAMFYPENVYDIPHMRIKGQVCYTNTSSNTAFRGFGAPQSMLIAENWIERMASELQKRPEEIKEINFHTEGYVTHYGQQLQNCTLDQVWDELKASCDFSKALDSVNEFNTKNRWRKRGIAMIPNKFGIAFTSKFLNQAGALVQVYLDGTVLVTHGGVEMGQGLHTKVAQIAASSFNIPLSSVFISDTSTDKVPNTTSTAASASSDMYGAAVLDACEQLKERMKPIAIKNPKATFTELVQACYFERIDLSAHGFYITPDIGFDWKIGKGNVFSYYTYAAAFAEVEIDTLTGDFHTRTVDIVMDLGYSLNPAIDIGQIEGAFMQGLGWVALEELKWGDADHKWIKPGNLYTCGPGTYKIPSVNDIPLKFKVSLLKGVPNPKAIHSSKAVGEPPLFLASAVFFAIKDAIKAARAEEGVDGWFPLDNPATPERIRMACIDDFTRPFAGTEYRPKISI
ncbi:xanthine dehydrogenase-like isoform X2 [Asparagus officinalis]|uniref:xanthine dehydrogenase-like isoform X2 n=1 Tax=Asparagus officinalis TaxID=4686 RepID=UPI00098E74D7|nr:xanthine dehydrogenase-like isoform X2 [Asparagus officinalis]